VRCRVSQHDMDAAALGRLDSGGRRTSRGRDGRAANRGGGGRERTGEAMGSGWVREGEAVRRDADMRARQHSGGRREFKLDSKLFQMNSNLPKL
jgi:hypothetical protein